MTLNLAEKSDSLERIAPQKKLCYLDRAESVSPQESLAVSKLSQ